MRRSIITIVGATAALSLTACGLAPEQESAAPPSSSSSEVTPEPWTDEATPDEVPEPSSSADSMVVGLGETFTWEDGTTARIEAPQPFQKSEWAAGGEGYSNVISFKVTVTNGSDVPLDASFTSPTVTSGEREGDEIFDDEVAPTWDHQTAYWTTDGGEQA